MFRMPVRLVLNRIQAVSQSLSSSVDSLTHQYCHFSLYQIRHICTSVRSSTFMYGYVWSVTRPTVVHKPFLIVPDSPHLQLLSVKPSVGKWTIRIRPIVFNIYLSLNECSLKFTGIFPRSPQVSTSGLSGHTLFSKYGQIQTTKGQRFLFIAMNFEKISDSIFPACKRSCGNLMFLQVSVCPQSREWGVGLLSHRPPPMDRDCPPPRQRLPPEQKHPDKDLPQNTHCTY